MTIKQIYDLAITLGREADFRSKSQVEKTLERKRERFGKMDEWEKGVFDMEQLANPYSDTRILVGDSTKPVKKVLAGIDMEAQEMLLAKILGDIDLVIAHHPEGIALAGLDDVMHLQADVLLQYGVPIHFAENLLRVRISEVARGLHPINHERALDTAKLLDIAFMSVHTPADNLVARFLDKKIKSTKIERVGDLMKMLRMIPEYTQAITQGAGPRLFTGHEDNRVGKIALTEITGGTEGSPKLYEKLSQAGISTVVGMHVSEKHKEAAEEAHLNVVIAGHMSSDSIGMNLFLDELEKRGIEVITTSGLIRVNRLKKEQPERTKHKTASSPAKNRK